MNANLFDLRNIEFGYGARPPILHDLHLSLAAGERVAICGANGSGKTSLLHLMAGLLHPRQGSVIAFGSERHHERDFIEVRRRAGLVFQDPDDQLFCPTVAEDVAFGPLNLGHDHEQAAYLVDRTLAALGLSDLAPRPINELSGGEKRLVSLAGVLAMEPEVLLLDEPTNGLDEGHRERLIELLAELPQALLIVSHDQAFRRNLATRTLKLAGGRLEPFDEG